jgi:hypothetical protein
VTLPAAGLPGPAPAGWQQVLEHYTRQAQQADPDSPLPAWQVGHMLHVAARALHETTVSAVHPVRQGLLEYPPYALQNAQRRLGQAGMLPPPIGPAAHPHIPRPGPQHAGEVVAAAETLLEALTPHTTRAAGTSGEVRAALSGAATDLQRVIVAQQAQVPAAQRSGWVQDLEAAFYATRHFPADGVNVAQAGQALRTVVSALDALVDTHHAQIPAGQAVTRQAVWPVRQYLDAMRVPDMPTTAAPPTAEQVGEVLEGAARVLHRIRAADPSPAGLNDTRHQVYDVQAMATRLAAVVTRPDPRPSPAQPAQPLSVQDPEVEEVKARIWEALGAGPRPAAHQASTAEPDSVATEIQRQVAAVLRGEEPSEAQRRDRLEGPAARPSVEGPRL